MKFIGDYPDNAKLTAVLLPDPDGNNWNNWNDQHAKWLRKNTGKVIEGVVVWQHNSLYFKPKGISNIILCDDEIKILTLRPVYAKKIKAGDVRIYRDFNCKRKIVNLPLNYRINPKKKTIVLKNTKRYLIWPELQSIVGE